MTEQTQTEEGVQLVEQLPMSPNGLSHGIGGQRVSDPGPGLHSNNLHGHRISDPIPGLPGLPGTSTDASKPADQVVSQLGRAKQIAEAIGESNLFTGIMTLFTFWALFQADIKFAATEKSADGPFEIIISILFFAFLFEIFLQSFYKEDYCALPSWRALQGETMWETMYRRVQIGGFYFWLDIIATLSLLLDMKWLIGQEGYDTINGGGVQSARAGKASKTGARAARVVRVVRMVRLVRMAKLYKYASAAAEKEKLKKQQAANGGATVIAVDDDMPVESKVGAAMSDLTNRRVIVLILMMLIIIPLLTTSDPDISLSLGVQVVHQLGHMNASNPQIYSKGLDLAIRNVQERLPLLQLQFNDYLVFQHPLFADRRSEELATFDLTDNGFTTRMAYDQHNQTVQTSLYSIYTTIFIIVLLVGGTFFFSQDVDTLVIGPIERLVDLVRKISANPLGVEYKMLGAKEGFLEGMETTMLLTTITKIGALMRVGFGEAGASIIAKNLSESSGGKLNLMGSGVMIRSIFGFCDVRQFTDTTECLQEEVMLFVNRIAHILHSIVVQCSGAANKNIGDAFLLTWKLDEKFSPEQVSSLADQALLTFCKSLIELARYQEFICNFSVAATARLFRRFPEYNVRIGCGLHVGWAIEGAIGSNRKIDASYLSPHVSATEYLESSTKAYGVSLLLSEPFFRLLSPTAAKVCRQVDRVRRSAHEQPMGLYTYDADLLINWNDPHRHQKVNPKERLQMAAKRALQQQQQVATSSTTTGGRRKSTIIDMHHRKGSEVVNRRTSTAMAARSHTGLGGGALGGIREAGHDEGVDAMEAAEQSEEARQAKLKQTPTIVVAPYTQQVWTEDADIVELRHRVNDAFRLVWEQGVAAYIKGDWQKAREVFQETLRQSHNKDGPSKFLLGVIDENGGTAPTDWAGYRDEGEGGH